MKIIRRTRIKIKEKELIVTRNNFENSEVCPLCSQPIYKHIEQATDTKLLTTTENSPNSDQENSEEN